MLLRDSMHTLLDRNSLKREVAAAFLEWYCAAIAISLALSLVEGGNILAALLVAGFTGGVTCAVLLILRRVATGRTRGR